MSLEQLELLQEYNSDQNIKFYENKEGNLLLVMDSYIQFVEGESERVYHRAITEPAKIHNQFADDFLILGGGDGLVARDLRKLYDNPNITLVEIDKKMIDLFTSKERLVKLNEESLNKCNIVIEDCKKWIKKTESKFDVIILDLPDPNSKELKDLYKRKFIADVYKLLKKGGIQIQQCHMDNANKLESYYKKIFKEVQNKHIEMSELTGINIVCGVKTKK
jgi:spermidine synthase